MDKSIIYFTLVAGFLIFILISIRIVQDIKNNDYMIEQLKDASYMSGFRDGVKCRGLMSAPLCELALEQSGVN